MLSINEIYYKHFMREREAIQSGAKVEVSAGNGAASADMIRYRCAVGFGSGLASMYKRGDTRARLTRLS